MWKICNRKTNHERVSSVNLVPQDRIQGGVYIMLKKKSDFLSNLVAINLQKRQHHAIMSLILLSSSDFCPDAEQG
jgi:hypothetical protein